LRSPLRLHRIGQTPSDCCWFEAEFCQRQRPFQAPQSPFMMQQQTSK
jgi:hypothetical protein